VEVEAMVVEELGSATHILFTVDAPAVDVDSVRAATDEGDRATLIATDSRALFTAEVAEDSRVRPGDRLVLALDTSRLHFFDPATGASLRVAPLASAA
jgi:multiple sugar transport system ATP-binding protein